MKDFGLHMIGRGLVNATFSEILNPYSHAMSIVHIAHGTEIVIKARIAEEHLLFIFSTLPKSTISDDKELGIIELLEKGRSIACTRNLKKNFGRSQDIELRTHNYSTSLEK